METFSIIATASTAEIYCRKYKEFDFNFMNEYKKSALTESVKLIEFNLQV